MSRYSNFILSSILFVIIVGICFYFMLDIRDKSIPATFENIIVPNIASNADIYLNKQDIPHIVSSSDDGMFFAMGYLHARQRLFTIGQHRLIAQGRLAEIYGQEYLHTDLFMRTLDLQKLSKKLFDSSDQYTQQILISYTNGINEYISKHMNKLPFEFGASDFTPEFWQPSDCFLIQRYWAFLLSNGFYYDILAAEIASKVGTNRALQLFPQYPFSFPHILDSTIYSNSDMQPIPPSNINISDTYNYKGINLLNDITNIMQIIGKTVNCYSGNTWATNIGNNIAILANDNQMSPTLPALWLQMHVSSPNFNVVGLTIPGMPIFLSGRNNSIAWGTTSMMVDDIDYTIQKISKQQYYYYISDTDSLPIHEFVDTIKIKNKAPYLYYKRSINGDNILNYMLNNNSSATPLTFKWTAYKISNEIGSIIDVMKANNWISFVNAVNKWNTPGLVFSFADTNCNIGIAPRAIIPIRNKDVNPNLPFPAWNGKKLWTNFIQPHDIPTFFNPYKKFVIAANNDIFRNSPYFISYYFAMGYRSERIQEMILNTNSYSYRDVQYTHNDALSLYAKNIIQTTKNIFSKYKHLLSKEESIAYNRMKNWNYILSANSSSFAIFNMFIAKILQNTFADELGSLYEYYIKNPNFSMQKLSEILNKPDDMWFDDCRTQGIEQRDYIVIQSFKDAIKELINLYSSSDINQWNYSEKHQVNFKHIYSFNKLFKNTFSVGGFPISGGITTTNNTKWNPSQPFKVIGITSMRFIADMKQNYTYSIISGGSSDDPVNPHYADQVKLWQIGAYIIIPMDSIPASDFSLSISLKPNK